jgi:hypothetical protein
MWLCNTIKNLELWWASTARRPVRSRKIRKICSSELERVLTQKHALIVGVSKSTTSG